jgi:hypothetical protein
MKTTRENITLSDGTVIPVTMIESEPSKGRASDMAAFERWWHDEGSGMPPRKGEDRETHVRRICEIAWSNGAYVAERRIAEGRDNHHHVVPLQIAATKFCVVLKSEDLGINRRPAKGGAK